MVIEKILKVNSTDPKAEELRQRLAALQQKVTGTTNIPGANPSSASSGQSAPVSRLDADVQQLQNLAFPDQKRVIEQKNPEMRLQEERTLSLVMTQISEIINLNNDANKKIRDLEAKNTQLEKGLEQFKDKHEELLQKMNSIDSRLEKFMGLYELITNQYNPFATPMPLPPIPSGRGNIQQTMAEQLAQQRASAVAGGSGNRPAPTTGQPQPPNNLTPQTSATPATGAAPAGDFSVEDSLTNERATVTIKPEDAAAASARFKRVEELLADLQQKHAEQQHATEQQTNKSLANTSAAMQTPPALTQELHGTLAAFEQRLTEQFDKTVQGALHERFKVLEGKIQNEIRDALRDEIDALQKDDAEVQQALIELQSLLQAREAGTKQPGAIEDEIAQLQRELGTVRDEIKSIPPNFYFQQIDGKVLKNIVDLRDSLQTMTPDVFAHHVAGSRNDFAMWVEHAIGMPRLAGLLRAAKTPQEMRAAVIAHDGMDD